ncbi:MAG TPA: hypothetical protein VHE61_01300 [Opitutaceae bacterium]|nr:hypothetical protein [Opitutaceae bacterium]
MTKYEKLALDSIAAMCDVTAALLSDNGAKAELLSQHLPDLTEEARADLRTQAEVQVSNARQLKENAATLRAITAQASEDGEN